jgi:beta-glucanase (GH16 family)
VPPASLDSSPSISRSGTHARTVAATTAAPLKVLFDDEFNATSLDRKAWSTCYFWAQPAGDCTNGGTNLYVPADVSVAHGSVNLVAKLNPKSKTYPYTDGMITTGGTPSKPATFSYLYGYAEARAKLPRGAGMWPAFWLLSTTRQWPPEIDILEWQGVAPTVDVVTIHWSDSHGNPEQNSSGVNTGLDLADGYHTYGLDWEAKSVTWYFDGFPIKTFTNSEFIPHKPMYLVLTQAIGGWLPGQNDPKASEFPATFSVDYVRVWNRRP